MSFGLGLSLRVSPALSLRQSIEARLEQGLFVAQKLQIILAPYLKREDELTRLYRKALRAKRVKLYEKHGMKFEYALVRAKDVPEDCKAYGNWAFSHCLYNKLEAFIFGTQYALSRGSWLLFVIYDMYPNMPEEYIGYAAVHERGEQITLGDHNLASKLEFGIAKEENRLTEYMAWLEEYCPEKFADVFSYQTHLDLPASDEFQEVLKLSSSSEEATRVRQMIEEFEWPLTLLKKFELYQKQNEKVVEIAVAALRTAEILAEETSPSLKDLLTSIRFEITRHLHMIIDRKFERYISYPHLEAMWHELRIGVDRKFVEMLNMRQRVNKDAYLKELVESKIADSLPHDGVLSLSFREALGAAS